MRPKEFYLSLLMDVLIDIRALEDSELALARKYADIFHNVPGALTRKWTPEFEQELYEEIRAKAAHHGLLEWLESLERLAYDYLADWNTP